MPKSKKPFHARQARPSALVKACDLYARTLYRRDAAQTRLAGARNDEATLRTALAAAEQRTVPVQTELSDLGNILLETGSFIQSFDARLLPRRIRAVRTTKGRYGSSGGLSGAILRVLAQASPVGLDFKALREAVIDVLGLAFASRAVAQTWSQSSFQPAIKRLKSQGDVTYLSADPGMRGGVWRLTGDVIPDNLDALRSTVEAASVISAADRPAG